MDRIILGAVSPAQNEEVLAHKPKSVPSTPSVTQVIKVQKKLLEKEKKNEKKK